MAYYKIDTQLMEDRARDMLKAIGEYEEFLKEMFNRLNNVQTHTGEWTGESAKAYFKYLMTIDRPIYMNFADDVKKYANNLLQSSNNFEQTIKEMDSM